MRYSDDLIEEVRHKASLAELVSERTQVKKSGNSITACCPFHSEKTPSFHINEEQGLYYCFGCGKKGNTFTFIMETRGLSFPESIRFLAQRYSVALPLNSTTSNYEKGLAQKKQLLGKILNETQNLYEDILWNRSFLGNEGNRAKEILFSRDLTEDTLKKFRIGFTGSSHGYLEDYLVKNISQSSQHSPNEIKNALIELGLLRNYSDQKIKQQNNHISNYTELFRERIIFPISRSDGKPIAFGGRTIHTSDKIPKYINSPESPVYLKRRSFYGLTQSIKEIQKTKTVYIVEGYTDVMSFFQAGLENTIAVCGTALTEDHVKILSRFITRAYLVFDSDAAGRIASAKSFASFINSRIEAIPVFLAEGEDPDTMARKVFRNEINRDVFLKILKDGETSLFKIFIQHLASNLIGLERGVLCDIGTLKPAERGKLAEEVSVYISKINNPVEKEIRTNEFCDLLGISNLSFKEILQNSFNKNLSYSKPDSISRNSINKVQLNQTPIQNNDKKVLKEINEENNLYTRRINQLKRQLIIGVIVDPSILKNEVVFNNAISLCKDDLSSRFFIEYIYNSYKLDSSIKNRILNLGISRFINVDKSNDSSIEMQEALANIHSLLCQFELENEGLLEEAIRQISTGGITYPELADSLEEVLKRVSLVNKVEEIKREESKISDEDQKLKLIQEKLFMKRSLDKIKNK